MSEVAHDAFLDVTDPDCFRSFFGNVHGVEIEDLTDEALPVIYSLWQYHADRILKELGDRELIQFSDGLPILPEVLPAGVEPPATVLDAVELIPSTHSDPSAEGNSSPPKTRGEMH